MFTSICYILIPSQPVAVTGASTYFLVQLETGGVKYPPSSPIHFPTMLAIVISVTNIKPVFLCDVVLEELRGILAKTPSAVG